MKAILLAVNSETALDILKKKASVLIRKFFPLNFKGWVYLYCTTKAPHCFVPTRRNFEAYTNESDVYSPTFHYLGNGKIIARFWCNKVEEVAYERQPNDCWYDHWFYTDNLMVYDLEKASCMRSTQLCIYLDPKKAGGEICGYAAYISKLEVFDEPKRITEFYKFNRTFENRPKYCDPARTLAHCCDGCKYNFLERKYGPGNIGCDWMRLREAPKNYCYIEDNQDE